MAKSIGSLFVEYRATADKYLADLKQMAKDSKEFERTLRPLVDHAKNLGIGFSVAGAAISGSLLAAAHVAANFGDKLDETAEKTGVAVQELGRLKYAAEQNDSSFEGLSTGLKFLSRNLFDAATGGKENTKIFSALGIQVKTSTGAIRPANDVLTDLSAIFRQLPDGAEKTALAIKIFGRAGQDLIPFLNQGPEGLKKLGDEAQRMGVVIDAASAKLGDEFNKALDRSSTATLGLSVAVGNVLLPSLTNLINKGNEAIIFATGIAQEFPLATKAALGLGAALTAIGGSLLGLAALGALAPKVAQGLLLIQAALAPASILLAVRNYGDLSAAITLLGQTSLIARVGLIALAAGIGIAVGQLINMGIELAGLQPALDRFILNFAKGLGFLRDTGQTLGNSTADIKRAAEALAARGIIVERGTKTEQQYIEALAKAAREHLGLKDKVAQTGAATSDYEKRVAALIAALTRGNDETDKASKKTRELKDEIAELSRSFISTIRPADELSGTLTTLLAKFSEQDVIKAYGDEIIAARDKQREFGAQVDGDIERLANIAMAYKSAVDIIKANRATLGDDPLFGFQTPRDQDFLNQRPIVPADDLIKDYQFLDFVLRGLNHTTEDGADRSAQMFAARAKDIENDARLSKRWEQAWSTAVGNISSKFADVAVEGLFNIGGDKQRVKSLENQITSIKRTAERERLQDAIDTTRATSKAHHDAVLALAAFDKRVAAEQRTDRARELGELEQELNQRKSLFHRFTNTIASLFKELGKSLLKIMVADVFNQIAKAFTENVIKPMAKAFGDFLADLVKKKATTKVFEAVTGGAGATTQAGGATGAAGGASQAAGSALTGWISIGLQVGQILTTAFAGRGRAQRTEENTRESRDWLELQTNAWNPLFNQMVYYQKSMWELFSGKGMISGNGRIPGGAVSLPGIGVASSIGTVNADFNFNPTLNFNIAGADRSELQIRDEMDKILTALETGIRGYRERLMQIVRDSLQAPQSTPVPVNS